ncbi:MAG: hypothetical protein FRX48_00516 [Lasallia pustulata]|uniref:NUDE domain-containing protein n=1 Tax=Lasallia pustulata TaxID=136370 RepID=A0A5M8Q129_9LECA|nr:MAG: hypothetical protein FRX48_00516 [Lasallia pustulata]
MASSPSSPERRRLFDHKHQQSPTSPSFAHSSLSHIAAFGRLPPTLGEKVKGLGFEVDEWKSKYKQSKAEANSAQNTLQKEITTLRHTNRTIQLNLRDIEVAHDDFERQARNTTSSLEDLESKYNVAIERGVMLEEEIKLGEQEREALRIETQRLRNELSDLKVEAEIMQDKLHHAGAGSKRQIRKPTLLSPGIARPRSPASEHSAGTTTSSPVLATPPTKSASSITSDAPTPPSPPISDSYIPASSKSTALPQPKSRISVSNSSSTPRPSHYASRSSRHSRGPSIPVSNGGLTPSISRRTTVNRPDAPQQQSLGLPHSGSLHQNRGLIGKMKTLEQHVYSARSKHPGPTMTPPLHSHKKRTGDTNVTNSLFKESGSESTPMNKQRLSRLSFGPSTAAPTPDNRQENTNNSTHTSGPSSRASLSCRSSIFQSTGAYAPTTSSINRPSSRQSSNAAIPPFIPRPSSRQGYPPISSTNRPSSRHSNAAIPPSTNRPASRQGYPPIFSTNRPSSRQSNAAVPTTTPRLSSRQGYPPSPPPTGPAVAKATPEAQQPTPS